MWIKHNKDRRFVEDRSYIEFLPNHCIQSLLRVVNNMIFEKSPYNPKGAPRKIYVDCGAASFESSVGWFHKNYPITFDEIHAFEWKQGRFQIPPPSKIGQQFFDSIHFYEQRVDTYDNPKARIMNFTNWWVCTLTCTCLLFLF